MALVDFDNRIVELLKDPASLRIHRSLWTEQAGIEKANLLLTPPDYFDAEIARTLVTQFGRKKNEDVVGFTIQILEHNVPINSLMHEYQSGVNKQVVRAHKLYRNFMAISDFLADLTPEKIETDSYPEANELILNVIFEGMQLRQRNQEDVNAKIIARYLAGWRQVDIATDLFPVQSGNPNTGNVHRKVKAVREFLTKAHSVSKLMVERADVRP